MPKRTQPAVWISPKRRLEFRLVRAATVAACFLLPCVMAAADTDRIRGLLIGALIGDALGGPMEFQPRPDWARLTRPPKQWQPGEKLDEASRAGLRERLILRPYAPLRPVPEPYAHWLTNAPAGTLTDDSRHKLILLHALRTAARENAQPLTGVQFARAYLDWTNSPAVTRHPDGSRHAHEWLEEYWLAARWVLGQRDVRLALPPERLWASLPTCAGQMALPPLAALYPGRPEAAYLGAWELGWLDNGLARDLNAAIVAGLAAALVVPAERPPAEKLEAVWQAMLDTDPWRFSQAPWSPRPTKQWLGFARAAVADAQGEPARLFAAFDREFSQSVKWEAQLCFAVSAGCLMLCPDDPLAALALSIEWGHDTDSYAQLAGAFVGALHGESLFPAGLRVPVERQLAAEYGESVAEWVSVLDQARRALGARPAGGRN